MAFRKKMKKKGGSVHTKTKTEAPAATPKKQLRLVAERNVEKMKTEGWKVADVDKIKDKHGRLLGIKSHSSDLILMEKQGE